MQAPGQSADETRWAACARAFLTAAVALLAGYLALAYALDPYDSGRSRLFSVGAVRPQGPRTAAAVRGRDPVFEGVILGNSHIQLIEPARLSDLTGIPFVQLSVPATGPGEQFVLLDWFLRHHPRPRALVIAADDFWCTSDPRLPNDKPFPFWLFADGTALYLRGLLRWSVLEEIPDRVAWLLGKRRETAARDGWWDYEKDYLGLGFGRDARRIAQREAPVPDTPQAGYAAGPSFPAAERFAQIAAQLPPETPLVLVFPPVYASALPRAGTPREEAEQACKAAVAGAVRRHRRSAVVDWRRDRPELHDSKLFFDQSHYRHPLARQVTADIAEAIRGLEGKEVDDPPP